MTEDAKKLLAASGLPSDVQARIVAIAEQSGLDGERQLDVVRELVAHFEDGLAAGYAPAELIESFGDAQRAARMIAKTKGEPSPPSSGSLIETRLQPVSKLSAGERFGELAWRLWRDLRYSVRRLAQSPGFAATAILSLALGIGANTAIFSLVNAVLLRDPPFAAPEELVEIYISMPEFSYNIFSYPDFRDLRDLNAEAFNDVAGSGFTFVSVDSEDGVEVLTAEMVTGHYFSLLGIEPGIGRLFGPEDDVAPGAHAVVVLGHEYWRDAYGGSPEVVGQEFRINGTAYTIIGVVPETFSGNMRGLVPELYTPIMMANELQPFGYDRLEARGDHWVFVKGRLRPSASLEQARVTMAGLASSLRADYPDSWREVDEFLVLPSSEVVLFPPIDRFLVPAAGVFMAVVGLVLLVACANLASFMLARALDRKKEIAVRLALGATRRSLVGQLVTESALLGALGGVAGVALSVWLLRLLLSVDLPIPLPISLDLGLDATVLTFSLLVSLGAGVLFGLIPALRATKIDVAAELKEGSTSGTRPGRVTLRNSLVVAQVALSLVLLVAAGLFLRSLQATQAVDPGFGRDPAGLLSVVVPSNRYGEEEGRLFVQRLVERTRQLPGVDAVGLVDNLHLTSLNTMWIEFNIDGVETPPGRNGHVADRTTVDAEFFEAAGVRILRGRNFNNLDTPESDPVAIVSDALVRRFWPEEEAIGRIIRRTNDTDLRIVGIASDAKVRTLGEAPRPFVYLPYSQDYSAAVTLVARTSVDSETTARDMLLVARELDPELMIFESKTMSRHIGSMLLPAQLGALVLTAFAGLALILAMIGLYGIVSYSVSQRTREVGIRLSLGADAGTVVRMLTAGGMRLVVYGCVVGLVLSLLLAGVMSRLLFGVSPFDLLTFLAVPLVLVGVAMLATYVPSRRASRVDPIIALRAE